MAKKILGGLILAVCCLVAFSLPPVVQDLSLVTLCSHNPANTRHWEVVNPNPFPVTFYYTVMGSTQTDTLVANPGSTFFFTAPSHGNAGTTRIHWFDENGDEQFKTRPANGGLCPVSLVAHYQFDDCGGDQGIDSQGNFNADIEGAPLPTTGYTGAALQYNGLNQYLNTHAQVLNPAQLQAGFTFAAWVKVKDNDEGKTIVGMVDSAGVEADGDILFRINNQEQLVIWWYSGGVRNILRHDSVFFSANQWYHVAASFNGAEMALFIDGTEVERAPATLDTVSPNITYIGGSNWSIHTFYGLLDEVRIYSDAMPAYFVANLAATAPAGVSCCPVPNEPIVYHKLNHCAGDTSVDQTNNFGGKVLGNNTWLAGYDEQTLQFDTLSYVKINAAPLSAANLQDGFSAAAWFQVEDNATGKTIISLAKSDTAEVDGEFALRLNFEEQLVAWWYNNGRQRVIFPQILNTGQWYHAAAVYDGTRMALYLDGVLVMDTAATLSSANTDIMYIGRGNKLQTSDTSTTVTATVRPLTSGSTSSVTAPTTNPVISIGSVKPLSTYSSQINRGNNITRGPSTSFNTAVTVEDTATAVVYSPANYPFYGLLDEVMLFDNELSACNIAEMAMLPINPVTCPAVIVRSRRLGEADEALQLETSNAVTKFSVYPNPATSFVKIDVPAGTEDVELSIYSLDGKLMVHRTAVENMPLVPIDNLTIGVYLIQVKQNGQIENFKLMKQ